MGANLSCEQSPWSLQEGFHAELRTDSIVWGCAVVKEQQWTPVSEVVRYRLRRGARIVGWMREESTGQRFYSREGLWWSGRKIDWSHRDRCCGLRDIDDRWLHEGDLVTPISGPWWRRNRQWLILCDERRGWSLVRSKLAGTLVSMTEEEVLGCRWRWCGFGWTIPTK